ncbi:UNVERIFIED_CONTAM: hypothetical protein Slati_2412100 [Sesamum latifolium]|uniref:Endonuclease/exonuclease/phosphatase domain-containing protein n=1 Tax=Sesamum latifolium TaxID=2727402 RepID=A0AAW2WEU2_9LAMI
MFVYAKCYRNSRRILWEELVKLSNQDAPWLVGGDFNVIMHPNENQGGDMQRLDPMDDFNDMMLETRLIDGGFEGDPFTWTNKRIWKRPDRVLYSKEWAEIFNITRVLHLPRRLSDHHPLCIEASKAENKKPSSFRFQNMWLHHHSFLQTVKQSWELPIEGYGMYKLQQKIYRTKELLKQWNRDYLPGIPDFPFQFSKIPQEINLNICSIPSDEDIKEIVFSIDKESVAGPDGFSSAFYQACWDFIARDIYDVVRDFFSGTPMPRSFTTTTIIIIPKVDPLRPGTISDLSLYAMSPIKFCQSSSTGRFHKLSRT